MKKVIITIALITLAFASFYYFSQNRNQDIEGQITIIIIDEIGDTVSNQTYTFSENDTLFSILDESFEVGCANSSYQLTDNCEPVIFGSRVILKIDGVTTNWLNSYISIYENDQYATAGIDSISLNDGDVIRLEYTSLAGDN